MIIATGVFVLLLLAAEAYLPNFIPHGCKTCKQGMVDVSWPDPTGFIGPPEYECMNRACPNNKIGGKKHCRVRINNIK
jgi:hypothetical protein